MRTLSFFAIDDGNLEAALALASLVILGVAIRLSFFLLRREDPSPVAAIVASGMLILTGLGALAHLLFGIVGFVFLAIGLLAFVEFRSDRRRADGMALLEALAAAADQQIGPDVVSRAIAGGRRDAFGTRVAGLASSLEQGMWLSQAIKKARLPLPIGAAVTIEIGECVGELSDTMQKFLDRARRFKEQLRPVLNRIAYVLLVGTAAFGVMFALQNVMLGIVPTLDDLDAAVPRLTLAAAAFLDWMLKWSLAIAMPLFAGVIVLLFLFAGKIQKLRPFRRWRSAADMAMVLHGLAVAVRKNCPLEPILARLAANFPNRFVAGRLSRCVRKIEAGSSWLEAVRQVRLITSREHAVLLAAVRSNSLYHALDAIADVKTRRWLRRTTRCAELLTSACFVAFACLVGFLAISTLLPLVVVIDTLV